MRVDSEDALIDEPAARGARTFNGQFGRRGVDGADVRVLTEDVCKPERAEGQESEGAGAPHPGLDVAPMQVDVS